MPLHLTGTWEHALLAATVKAAESGASGYVGRTALQKMMYFLQVAGVPMRYRFDLYHYGPYCDRITHDVEWLIADEVIRDASSRTEKYSNYRPAVAVDELIGRHPNINEHSSTIRAVVGALLPMQPEHLEIISTLDYLFRLIKAGGGHGPWKERVVERFMKVKKDKHSRATVEAAYDNLMKAGLIEP